MSQLINDTIEAYNLYLEGELELEDLEYGIEAGLISESLLLELDATMLSEVNLYPSAPGNNYIPKGSNGVEHNGVVSDIVNHVKDHATEYGAGAAGLAAAGAGAYALHKYLKNRKATKQANDVKSAIANYKEAKDKNQTKMPKKIVNKIRN